LEFFWLRLYRRPTGTRCSVVQEIENPPRWPPEGYFRHEWKLAIERAHHMAEQKAFLVPIVVDGTGDRLLVSAGDWAA
jgi:hypothetical protein